MLFRSRILNPANRVNMPLAEQLRALLEKLDLSTAMKSSPSRSKRLKLLKKTIMEVRSEMSLKKPRPTPSEPPQPETEEKPLPPLTGDKTHKDGLCQSRKLELGWFLTEMHRYLWSIESCIELVRNFHHVYEEPIRWQSNDSCCVRQFFPFISLNMI